jgi:hypothetical protein
VNIGKWTEAKHTVTFEQQFRLFQLKQTCWVIVTAYDEIFQATAAEGDVLLSKPVLDLGFEGGRQTKIAKLGDILYSFPHP